MIGYRTFKVTIHYLYSFFELQFVITLMSLPILIVWGIPISIMSPLANLIFTPLMILFLWFSCFFTICVLLHIPSFWVVWILEKITYLWFYLLSFANPCWLIGFPVSMIWISLIICFLIFCIYTFIKPTSKKACLLLFLFWITLIGVRACWTDEYYKKIGNLPLFFANINKKTYLIDIGALCTRKNLYTNIDYTVLPELIKKTGCCTIDTLVLCKPSARLDKIALQFALQTNIKTIIVTTKADSYQKIKTAFADTNILILPLLHKTCLKKHC